MSRQLCIRLTVLFIAVIGVALAFWRTPREPISPRPVAVATPAPVAPKPAATPTPAPRSKRQMIVFTATWCVVCRQQKPTVARIEAAGVKVWRIDIDERPDLASKYGVTAVPTYVFYDGDKEGTTTHDADDILKQVENL